MNVLRRLAKPRRLIILFLYCATATAIGITWYRQHLRAALFDAVQRSDLTAVRELLNRGAPTDNRHGYHPFEDAIYNRRVKIALALLQAGGAGGDMGAYLCESVRYGEPEVTEELLRRGESARTQCGGWTALMLAAGWPEETRLLLSHGADIHAVVAAPGHFHGETALTRAVNERNAASLGLLLDHGAEVNVIFGDRFRWTPLSLAAFHGDIEIATTLLGHGAKLNVRDKEGLTALTEARRGWKSYHRKGCDKIYALLKQSGATE